jgi:hypothetical protein
MAADTRVTALMDTEEVLIIDKKLKLSGWRAFYFIHEINLPLHPPKLKRQITAFQVIFLLGFEMQGEAIWGIRHRRYLGNPCRFYHLFDFTHFGLLGS